MNKKRQQRIQILVWDKNKNAKGTAIPNSRKISE
jgi:hypothetical protein